MFNRPGRIIALTLFVIALLTGAALPLSAQTSYMVDDDGQAAVGDCDASTSSFTDIQSAITAAANGDTIFVCPGTYPGALTVNKDLTISGFGGNPVITPSSGTDTYCGDPDSGSPIPATSPLVEVSANGITLTGLVLDGNNAGATRNIGIARAGGAFPNNTTMTGLTLRDFTHVGMFVYGGGSVRSLGNTISGNVFTNIVGTSPCYSTGILLLNEAYGSVTGNSMSAVGTGLRTTTYTITPVAGSVLDISGNNISATGTALYLNNHTTTLPSFTVNNNTITGGARGIRFYSFFVAGSVSASGNTITGAATGIQVWSVATSVPLSITNTTINEANVGIDMFDCSGFGAQFAASSITFDGITIDGTATGTAGIRLDDGACAATGLSLTVNNGNVRDFDAAAVMTGVGGSPLSLTLNSFDADGEGAEPYGVLINAAVSPTLNVTGASVFTGFTIAAIDAGANPSPAVNIQGARIQSNAGALRGNGNNVTIGNSCIVNNIDPAVSTAGSLINAQGNWWGSSWGPNISAAPGGSGSSVSTGDMILSDGNNPVDVDLTSAGDYENAPSGNWLGSAPLGCMSCDAVSSVGHTRNCS